ncbi:unnamed protein product [Rhizoctonia solani]|uniref:Laminin domain protein n=1 Tax=Rhizoctonia solani TaxID=456999 RepID=A0A8H2X7D0_9AGAM|nr:unnamed protein product [Rhizoctonia solani]
MVDHSGWYPPGQVCYPPELPTYLKNVHDPQPIVGVPSDDEVVGIHTVIQAATRASNIPGMHDPVLFMKLTDHLFSVQMLVYRNKYTSLMFPTDVTYTPPALPAHVPVNLEPISCAPSDEEVTKVQDAIRTYHKYSKIPSMFEPLVSAELSQHLFDIQMARYMNRAAQRQPNQLPQETTQPRNPTGATTDTGNTNASNNAGTGDDVMESHPVQITAVYDILERSNQLVERANQLSERSNQLIERSNQIAERTNQLIDRPDQPAKQSNQPTDQPSTNSLAERFNELLGRLKQYLERSNQLAEGFKTPADQIGDTLKTINKVLVGIQHAVVRSYKGNPVYSLTSLINEKGDYPTETSWMWYPRSGEGQMNAVLCNQRDQWHISDTEVAYYLRFYGLEGDFFEDPEKTRLSRNNNVAARNKLGQYFTSALAW